jgi:hypothetical protein
MSKGRKTKVFRPTDAPRRAVSMLAALHVSWDEIRLCVINPANGEAIAKSTLSRALKKELSRSAAALKELVASKYFEALERGDQWAIRAGLRQRFGWTFEGSQPPLEAITSFANGEDRIAIKFVMPSKPPVDITPPSPPPSPYAGEAPDLSKPALEPPSHRTVDPGYGLGPWRTDSDPKGWMK